MNSDIDLDSFERNGQNGFEQNLTSNTLCSRHLRTKACEEAGLLLACSSLALGRHYDQNFQILSKNFRPFFFLSKQNIIQ